MKAPEVGTIGTCEEFSGCLEAEFRVSWQELGHGSRIHVSMLPFRHWEGHCGVLTRQSRLNLLGVASGEGKLTSRVRIQLDIPVMSWQLLKV